MQSDFGSVVLLRTRVDVLNSFRTSVFGSLHLVVRTLIFRSRGSARVSVLSLLVLLWLLLTLSKHREAIRNFCITVKRAFEHSHEIAAVVS